MTHPRWGRPRSRFCSSAPHLHGSSPMLPQHSWSSSCACVKAPPSTCPSSSSSSRPRGWDVGPGENSTASAATGGQAVSMDMTPCREIWYQVAVDRGGVVTDTSFAAKRVVLGAGGVPLRSRGGRLLVHDCTCETLRAFGSIAASECIGERLEFLRNRMLFSPTAPPSFLRTLVRKIGLPGTTAACAQVVEEALTTSLTDRPYNPLVLYAGISSTARAGHAGEGARRAHDSGLANGVVLARGLGTETNVDAWRRHREDELADEETGLAEVDFRQQYDDFA